MFDIVAIGDAIVDVLVTLPKDDKRIVINTEKHHADIELGAKIPVENSAFSIGGNATHVAIGLTRLGFRAALAAELGTDEFAEKILKDLDKEHIGKSLLIQTPGAISTFTVSLSMGNDRTTLVRHVTREHNFQLENVGTKWIYLTSMGDKWETMYAKTLSYVKKTGTKLAFNPGSTQMKKGVDSFKDIVETCDLLIVNKQEAEQIVYKEILPYEKKESPESLLFRLNRMGPKNVVLTDGSEGSWVIDEKGIVFAQKTFDVSVTEKTGAGDGFSAGFLGGLLLGKSMQECLLWGTANATGVITKIGGQEGLLTREQLQEMIHKEVNATDK